ncbi:MAG: DUF296 domain-containing protein [Verrucomicrobiota bacterium]|nr:DUF296 domain-containing protein [Verrucomicrobiota bacterium]
MTTRVELKPSRQFMGRLRHNADLLDELTAVCRQEKIRCGWVTALGAVQKARIAFYDRQA